MSDEGQQPTPIVLALHRLTHQISFGVNNYAPQRLILLLNYLTERGLSFANKQTTNRQSGETSIILTFDDGYQHLARALPDFIETYRLAPVLFIPTDFIGKTNRWDYSSMFREERHLSRSELLRLTELGVRFGSHGCAHTDLTRLTMTELRRELRESKAILEDLLQIEIDTISYPFGRCDTRVIEAAAETDYRRGYTMRYPTPDDLPLAIGRIGIYSYDTPLSVRFKICRGPMQAIERSKAQITNRLAKGTTLFNRFFKDRV